MKWITREHVKVDRVACPWLIKKFVDREAIFLFMPSDKVIETAKKENATPFDVPGVELGHHAGRCSFEAIVAKYHLEDPAVHLMAQIVSGADIAPDTHFDLYNRPEAPGLRAIALGFAALGFSDHELLDKEAVLYDALYAWCKAQNKL
jgi:hypothetical protein